MQSQSFKVVILGTGGTIAGVAPSAGDNIGYTAAQLGVAQLIRAVPALASLPIEAEQVAQVDSKDMTFELWQTLAQRVAFHLQRGEVAGIVVTHGTDTLEETAYFLQRVLAPAKPVVMTAAMRPASALLPDGPQNLLDAVNVAGTPGACGVVAVLAGCVHSSLDVRKVHSYRMDAFGSGDAGVLARLEEGRVRLLRDWPRGTAFGLDRLPANGQAWPAVEILTSHASAADRLVVAAVAGGVRGLVIAGTGNGSVHRVLDVALKGAQAQGVRVLRSTRCLDGPVQMRPDDGLPGAGHLTPVQARIELLLQLIARDAAS